VFSLFFGTAMTALGERSRPVIEILDALAHVMLKVTGYVMLFAVFDAATMQQMCRMIPGITKAR